MGSVAIMELPLLTDSDSSSGQGRIIPGADCLMNNYREPGPGPGAIISGSGAGDKGCHQGNV